jgi:hypothetical protein
VSRFEALEARELLSTLPVSQPMFQVGALVADTSPPSGAYSPSQIQKAYQYNQVSFNGTAGTGSGETIAIVDAYNDPNIQADLNAFDTQYGLAATTVTQVNETGGSALPAADSTGGWELEESLDVEWAHAMAPGARIILVEASSANDTDLLAGVSYAASHANVVSMSWGGGEFSGESSYDGDFSKAGVAFVASSGDNGAPISWPAASPNVLAVGGTALTLGSGGAWASETGWNGSGGGPSAYESQPSYQSGVVTATSKRANPDVAYDASPNTGYAVYDSYAYSGTSYGWMEVGGTSAGAPQWAAILAIADQGRALSSQPAVDSSSAQEVMTTLYRNPGDFHDITTGSSTGSPHYNAGPGYDYVTGLGTPMVNLVIGSLDGITTTAAPDTIAVSAPTTATAGTSFSYTVTADKAAGGVDTGYTGTVSFAGTDAQMSGLPSSYTFTSGDAGSHTFTVTLKTAGSQRITETSGSGTTTSSITVNPAAASQLVISGLSSMATVGGVQSFTVTAKDAYGNVATGYTGTVSFSSTDPSATLPANDTFTASNAGVHTFTVTFATAGSQSVTVQDTGSSSLKATQSGISVAPAAPTNLAATVISSSQINLTWTAAAGATGYDVQRSTNSGFTTGTVTQFTTTGTNYSDTGLSAGTTYYYRVIATGGNVSSTASNMVTATTNGLGSPPVGSGTDSIWASSYTPSENAYSYGTYELGLKFTSTSAGQVTGVRFYKESWMSGANVGHLWSSSGTLLASATFTNETSSGWQQVNFSSPVTIQANTVYIVSFSTHNTYFGISTGYFNSGGVTNGPLTAPSNSAAGGNGVYQNSGDFPNVSGTGMNFWVDVAFSPSSTTSVKPSTVGVSTPAPHPTATGSSGVFVTSPAAATPSGPLGVGSGSQGASASNGVQGILGLIGAAYRSAVAQEQTPSLWGSKGTSFLG